MKKAAPTKSSRLGRKLKQIRLALGLSQSEILERLGFRALISQQHFAIRAWLRVSAPPVLLKYARLAHVDLEV